MQNDDALIGDDEVRPEAAPTPSASRSRKLVAVGSGAVLVSGMAGFVTLSGSASAAGTIVVDSLTDDGTGTTLREAIEQANADAGEDVITFQSGLSGTISLASDLPTIDEAVTIQGPGADVITVDGGGSYALFNFYDIGTGTNRLSGLTLTGGNADNNDNSGGAVFVYYGSADLEITDMVMRNNYASNDGGAISLYDADGNVTITRTLITGNTAAEGGGALYAYEDTDLTVTIVDSTITGNTAGSWGGALYLGNGADLTVTGTTISGNTAGGGGGGISIQDGYATILTSTVSGNTAASEGAGGIGNWADSMTIRNSTISGNSAALYGGGLYNSDTSGPVTIENSTISGNTASQAGAIYGAYGGLTVVQSTITGNTATTGQTTAVGGIQTSGGGAPLQGLRAQGGSSNEHGTAKGPSKPAAAAASEVELDGTIVAGNVGQDLGTAGGTPVVVSDHSVLGTVDGSVSVTDLGGTQTGVTDPKLGPLAANGGPTQTHALLAGSPAIDGGPVPVPTFPGNEFDQRGAGYARVVNGQVDVGAYEVQADEPQPDDVSPDVVTPSFTG